MSASCITQSTLNLSSAEQVSHSPLVVHHTHTTTTHSTLYSNYYSTTVACDPISCTTVLGRLVNLATFALRLITHFKMCSTIGSIFTLASLIAPSIAQTFSQCNPTLRSDCPPESALGRTVNIDFSSASDSFTAEGSVSYGKDGATMTVAKPGDAPQLTSKWHIMYGRVDAVIKTAPGAGIVSSLVMLSSVLDEVDLEWLGADSSQVQSNYFYHGL